MSWGFCFTCTHGSARSSVSVCLSVSDCLSLCVSVSLCPSVCLSVCLSVFLPLSLIVKVLSVRQQYCHNTELTLICVQEMADSGQDGGHTGGQDVDIMYIWKIPIDRVYVKSIIGILKVVIGVSIAHDTCVPERLEQDRSSVCEIAVKEKAIAFFSFPFFLFFSFPFFLSLKCLLD